MKPETIHCPSCSSDVPLGKKFCSDCGAAMTDAALARTATSLPPRGSGRASGVEFPPPAGTASKSGMAPFESLDQARWLPGTMVAGRYRIVGLLGRGGMGEVYRADDVKLGQPVALKFLPEAIERDADRLMRFHNEVRTARSVSHPNVCRVYDIGEVDGMHYLSMEYVDGEDLSTLLRRIGRLPRDKSIQIARQLCAGLAAAHEQGILHRDLKPANVMIDGRGQARITDFGLAGLAERFDESDFHAGTPPYMAPEQLAGRDVSVRSDVYSLGVVLYELFTGRRPFDASSRAELVRLQDASTPATPSSLVDGIDPLAERVILRCLEKEPGRRPPSALAVAAALPGGDLLAAALAAGETPSPEMVAAAGEEGTMRPWLAAACVLAVLAGVGATLVVPGTGRLLDHAPLPKPPDVLVERARGLLAEFGSDESPEDMAYGFSSDTEHLQRIEREDRSRDRWKALGTGQPPAVTFWYRQSPRVLVPVNPVGRVSTDDPPRTISGMACVILDPRGNLHHLEIVPPQKEEEENAGAEGDRGATRSNTAPASEMAEAAASMAPSDGPPTGSAIDPRRGVRSAEALPPPSQGALPDPSPTDLVSPEPSSPGLAPSDASSSRRTPARAAGESFPAPVPAAGENLAARAEAAVASRASRDEPQTGAPVSGSWDPAPATAAHSPDWDLLFKAAGLDRSSFAEATPVWVPSVFSDSRAAWEGVYPARPEVPIRVEAAAFRGRPVYFQIVDPWTRPWRMQPRERTAGERIGSLVAVVVILGVPLGALFLARHNLRLGRGDRKGALRVSLFVVAIWMTSWLFSASHVMDFAELWLFFTGLSLALLLGGIVWLCYIALEPFVRRLWPDTLISWNRMLAGRFRDPLVGRDLLFGGLFAVAMFWLVRLRWILPRWIGQPTPMPLSLDLDSLMGGRHLIARLLDSPLVAVAFPIFLLFLVLLLRVTLRRTWIAIAAFYVVLSVPDLLQSQAPLIDVPWNLVLLTLLIVVLFRFGLLALCATFVLSTLMDTCWQAADLSAWYSGAGLVAGALMLVLVGFGFYANLAGRPLMRAEVLERT